jgi:nucleoside-diphosphate-sugar epimerase
MKHGRQGFITTFIRNAIEGEPIRVFGDGSQLRDFTYVGDAADAFLAAGITDAAYGQALNVGGQEPVSLIEVARLCQELAGEGGAVETVPWPPERERIDIGSIYVDHSRLTEATGWEPKVGLRDGLAETIEFYKHHRAEYWS